MLNSNPNQNGRPRKTKRPRTFEPTKLQCGKESSNAVVKASVIASCHTEGVPNKNWLFIVELWANGPSRDVPKYGKANIRTQTTEFIVMLTRGTRFPLSAQITWALNVLCPQQKKWHNCVKHFSYEYPKKKHMIKMFHVHMKVCWLAVLYTQSTHHGFSLDGGF